MRSLRTPNLRRHKPSSLGVVTLIGKDHDARRSKMANGPGLRMQAGPVVVGCCLPGGEVAMCHHKRPELGLGAAWRGDRHILTVRALDDISRLVDAVDHDIRTVQQRRAAAVDHPGGQ